MNRHGIIPLVIITEDWFQGCTVGYCEKVCPTGAFTNDNRSVTFRGNKGPEGTGSNGNAGPVSADTGLAVDPAAETYKKQIQVMISRESIKINMVS